MLFGGMLIDVCNGYYCVIEDVIVYEMLFDYFYDVDLCVGGMLLVVMVWLLILVMLVYC